MKRLLLIACVLACGKSDTKPADNKPADKPAKPADPAPPPADKPPPPPEPVAKSSYAPNELWDWATKLAAQGGVDMLDAFNKPFTVTGTIAKVSDNPTGEYELLLDAGDKHTISVTFADFGTAAKAKKPKAGDALTANKCTATKPTADKLTLRDCVLP